MRWEDIVVQNRNARVPWQGPEVAEEKFIVHVAVPVLISQDDKYTFGSDTLVDVCCQGLGKVPGGRLVGFQIQIQVTCAHNKYYCYESTQPSPGAFSKHKP